MNLNRIEAARLREHRLGDHQRLQLGWRTNDGFGANSIQGEQDSPLSHNCPFPFSLLSADSSRALFLGAIPVRDLGLEP